MVFVNTIKFAQKPVTTKSVRKAAKNKLPKLRKSLTPGTVVIPLQGQFRGKRIVFLKQLAKSGMLLCSGPYKLNGVPLRRVSASMVIATSTKIDVSKVDTKAIDDGFFKVEKVSKEKKDEAAFSGKALPKKEVSAGRKAAQKSVDTAILAALGKDAVLKKYLGAKFALSAGQNAHELKF
jgi:large subunit ribosomal protein L6e